MNKKQRRNYKKSLKKTEKYTIVVVQIVSYTDKSRFQKNYKYNINGDGKNYRFKISKPCAHCTHILKMFGIKNIYYSNDEGDIIKMDINEYVEYSSGTSRYFTKK